MKNKLVEVDLSMTSNEIFSKNLTLQTGRRKNFMDGIKWQTYRITGRGAPRAARILQFALAYAARLPGAVEER